jgi:hypothetical protein
MGSTVLRAFSHGGILAETLMAPGAVMIAMNGILGANSSPFGSPLRDANPGMSPALANMMTNPGAYGGDMRVSNSMGMEPAPLSQQVMPMQNTGGGMGGGIGSLLEPIQAHLIQRYNESKVVPLLNNFERQLMQLGSPQGGMGGYGGGPQRMTTMGPGSFERIDMGGYGGESQRVTTMGPESFGPPITRSRVQFEPGFDASAYLQ